MNCRHAALDLIGFTHESVNHSAGKYVRATSHVNVAAEFWARLKNSILGAHIHISGKRLQHFEKEFEYRYDRRARPQAMFGELVARS